MDGKYINKIYKEAMVKVSYLQPWPGHFLVKKVDTEIIIRHINHDNISKKKCLEIGCGNAFQSALFANFSHKFIATDLFSNDDYHKTRIRRAKELIQSLNAGNISLINCSATALPFADSYFDFIFSSSVLEHIKDRALVLKEIKRVLKPGGTCLIVVPTHMASIYAFPHAFLYILARLGKLVSRKKDRPIRDDRGITGNSGNSSLFARFRKNHPSFPLPEPHGVYKNIMDELVSQLPFNWMRLLKNRGFKIKKSFGLCFMPWLLIEPFSTEAAAKLYGLTKNINIKLSTLKKLEYMSYLVGFIAIKDSLD